MAQRVEALAAEADNLSLIHQAHIVEGDNSPLQVVFWPPSVHCGVDISRQACMHTQTYTCTYSQTLGSWDSNPYFFLLSGGSFYLEFVPKMEDRVRVSGG